MKNPQDITHPTLVLIRGVPGSGKTYLTAALAAMLGAQNVMVLDPDSIDLQSGAFVAFSAALTKDGVDQKFHPYRWSRAKAYDAIEANKIIIWNQPFTDLDGFKKTIVNLQTYATDHGTRLPLLVVEVEVSQEVAKQRVAERKKQGGHGPSDATFARRVNDYRSFSDEGFTTVTVSGEEDVAASVVKVANALNRLWQHASDQP